MRYKNPFYILVLLALNTLAFTASANTPNSNAADASHAQGTSPTNTETTPKIINSTLMVVKHYDAGYSPALRPYMYDLLDAILKTTEAEFGPYRIEINGMNLSAVRSKVETERGKLLNVLFAPSWLENKAQGENIVEYKLPAFHHMLGLRSLIVNKNTDISNAITQKEDFLKYSAGLGYSWKDVAILRSNKIPVVEAQLFDNLFPMLESNRFNYIPLSVLEIDAAIASKERQFPNIQRLPNIYIFYPMAFHIYVNKNIPFLNERIELGLKRIKGQRLNEIFDKHFFYIDFDDSKNNQLFIASNASLGVHENARITREFLARFGDHFNLMK